MSMSIHFGAETLTELLDAGKNKPLCPKVPDDNIK